MAYECVITTVIGVGGASVGDGGLAKEANLNNPTDLQVVSDGSLLIADTFNNRIRRVSPDGYIETIAGSGTAETQELGDGLLATKATLRFPRGLGIGDGGALYIADSNHYIVRRVDPSGIITTIAGNRYFFHSGEDVDALRASFSNPTDVVVDVDGNIYIADPNVHRIRVISPLGMIRTFAGTGEPGSSGDGGAAIKARLNGPRYLAIDSRGGLLIGGYTDIRRIDLETGIISTLPSMFGGPVAADTEGRVYFLEEKNVLRYDPVANQTAMVARGLPFSRPSGLAVGDSDTVFIADEEQNVVWRVEPLGSAQIIAGGAGPLEESQQPGQAEVFDSQGLVFHQNGNLYFTDFQHHTIRMLATDGQIIAIAGDGRATYGGDGGHPLSASFSAPRALAVDSKGNLLFIDETIGVGAIRLITPGSDGVVNGSPDERISTVAGQVVPRDRADLGKADGGPANVAVFLGARGFAIDSQGNLYVADWLDNRVRKIDPGRDGVVNGGSDEIITTIAGTGFPGSTGDGGPATQATVSGPNWLAVDSHDNLYIQEEVGLLRRIDSQSGIISTLAVTAGSVSFAIGPDDNVYYATGTQIVRIHASTGQQLVIAGTGERGYSGDGGDARLATFQGVGFLAVNSVGDVYAADNGNFRIRRIAFIPLGAPSPEVETTGTPANSSPNLSPRVR